MSKSTRRSRPDLNMVRKELDAIIGRGHSSYKVFEDWVALMFYAFQKNDPEYLQVMGKYDNKGPHGNRPADHFANALAALMLYMGHTNNEALGPLYEEYAANHYAGQFFTPGNVAAMMAKMTMGNPPEEGNFTIADPACGAGICLLSAAKSQTAEQNNRAFFFGQDLDVNCVRMTALNLMFFNLEGMVVWGNSLTMEIRAAWRTCRSLVWGGSLHPYDTEKARAWLCGTQEKPQKQAEKCVKISTDKPPRYTQLSLLG